MSTKSTHTQHSRQRRYVAGSSRGTRSATTLLAQVADIERGTRIRERREELHLTQAAVVDLLEEAAKALPRSHGLHPSNLGKPPVTLRGYQTYEQGGGIVWEKAKLLAGVLQIDVQAMMSGEPDTPVTPDLSRPVNADSALAEVLAAITAQLAAQTEVLVEVKTTLVDVKGVLVEVKDLLGKDTETADEMRTLTGSLDGAAARLDAHVKELETRVPQSAPRRKPAAKRKSAPKSSPRP